MERLYYQLKQELRDESRAGLHVLCAEDLDKPLRRAIGVIGRRLGL